MTIPQNNIKFNEAAHILDEVVSNGNIVPHSWYKELTNKRGDPDYSLICVLAEIVSSYRVQMKADTFTNEVLQHPELAFCAWQVSYAHFYNKFGFTRHKMRRVMERLEELNIAKREYRKLLLCGYYHRVLFIHLNLNYFKQNILNDESNSDLGAENPTSYLSLTGKNFFKPYHLLSSLKSKNSSGLQICSGDDKYVKNNLNQNNKLTSILTWLFNFHTHYLRRNYPVACQYLSP